MHSPAASSKEVGSRPERERFLTVSMEAADYAIATRLSRLSRGCASGPQEARRGSTSAASSSKGRTRWRSEEHTSELQSLMRISYAVFCLKKKKRPQVKHKVNHTVTKHA